MRGKEWNWKKWKEMSNMDGKWEEKSEIGEYGRESGKWEEIKKEKEELK